MRHGVLRVLFFAVQHMVGCNRSGAIFAINKDKNAPIFKQCDFGLIGDIKDVLPAITAAL